MPENPPCIERAREGFERRRDEASIGINNANLGSVDGRGADRREQAFTTGTLGDVLFAFRGAVILEITT